MRREPSIPEKIDAISDPLELEGFLETLFTEGTITHEHQQHIARRRAELQRDGKGRIAPP